MAPVAPSLGPRLIERVLWRRIFKVFGGVEGYGQYRRKARVTGGDRFDLIFVEAPKVYI